MSISYLNGQYVQVSEHVDAGVLSLRLVSLSRSAAHTSVHGDGRWRREVPLRKNIERLLSGDVPNGSGLSFPGLRVTSSERSPSVLSSMLLRSQGTCVKQILAILVMNG
ncbi:hypothetical protein Mapa_005079 [Marchantia paleacea]|nr:hypothetical protein Mapa_005079 [Marchantia paleacea]